MGALLSFCPKCGSQVELPLPVEPLYSLEHAAQLVPCALQHLKQWISRHKDRLAPAQYRWWHGQRRRLLSASDIRTIRAAFVSGVRYPETWRSRARKAEAEQAAGAQPEGDSAST